MTDTPDAPEPTSAASPQDPATVQLDAVRHLVSTATQRLLGDTIVLTDEQWRGPSRLPGWTRGHVASHVARQADAVVRLTGWAVSGERQDMYASSEHRESGIEAGAGRSGLDLQIDLDTSAGRLDEALDQVAQQQAWDAEIELRGGLRVRARVLPLARLTEIVLHHVDLDAGFDVDDVDEATAGWLLEWSAFRLRSREEFPRLHLVADSGLEITVGSSGEVRDVTGSAQRLLGWLTGRSPASDVDGADTLVLPAF